MAEGIRRRHSKGCPAKHGKRCTCNAGWEASFHLEPGGRRIEANVIAVECGWDQVEGVIEPKSLAGRRTIPLLAIPRRYLEGSLERSGSGEDLVFGRTTEETFYASTIDHRAKRAWKQANTRAVDAAEREGGEGHLLMPITLHECRHTFASLLMDAAANPKPIQQFMGDSKIQTTPTSTGTFSPGATTRSGSEWTPTLGPETRFDLYNVSLILRPSA